MALSPHRAALKREPSVEDVYVGADAGRCEAMQCRTWHHDAISLRMLCEFAYVYVGSYGLPVLHTWSACLCVCAPASDKPSVNVLDSAGRDPDKALRKSQNKSIQVRRLSGSKYCYAVHAPDHCKILPLCSCCRVLSLLVPVEGSKRLW